MRTGVSGRDGRLFTRALLSVLALAGAGSAASAQTAVTLNQPTTQVVSATVRGGSYADKNDQWTLETRAADNLEYERRALLKFDTQNAIPNLILSRFPIDASEPRLLSGDRSAVNVAIDVNGRTINFTSTHLHPDSSSYRTTEIGELKSWESGLAEQRIIAGDFNASYTSSENALMKQTYYDSWAEAQADGPDITYAGNPSGVTRNSPIDFIYYSHGAKNLALKSSQVYDTRDSKGVMPSDHRPIMSILTIK